MLLGTVLSWEGRYDEARRELEAVLAGNPTHGDALPALINVELWSGHSAAAEELANSLQTVTLLSTKLRRQLAESVQEALELEAAADKAVRVIRQLQPRVRRPR